MAIKIKFKINIVHLVLLFCLVAVFFVFVNIIRFIDKGFELSDETFYLSNSLNFNSSNYSSTYFGLLNNFFCFGHPTLLNLRLAKLIYQSFAVLIFTFSIFHFFQHRGFSLSIVQKIFILIIALMTSFCNYDYLPMTLSYNSWSLIITALCFSVIFIEYTIVSAYSSFVASLIYGFLFFSLFLAKLPNGVIILFIYLVFNLFSIKNNIHVKFFGIIMGVYIGYLLYLNNFQDLKNILENYYVTLFEVKHVKANSYLNQFNAFFLFCVKQKYILFELLIVLLAVISKKLLKQYKSFITGIILLANYAFAGCFFKGNSVELYNDFIVASIFIMNVILFIYFYRENVGLPWPKKEFALIIFFLFVIPFLLMLGTDNLFYYTTSQTMVFTMIAITIYQIYLRQLSVSFLAFHCSIICIFIICILYQGAVITPYRQNNLSLKTYPIHFSEPIDGIYESYEKFVDYTTINILVNKFNTSKKPVFTFFNHVGLSYINNCKVFPETIISDAEHAMNYNDYILSRYHFDNRFDLLILPETVENSQKFKQLFTKYGIFFKENYKLRYVYKFLSTDEKVYFYKKQIKNAFK